MTVIQNDTEEVGSKRRRTLTRKASNPGALLPIVDVPSDELCLASPQSLHGASSSVDGLVPNALAETHSLGYGEAVADQSQPSRPSTSDACLGLEAEDFCDNLDL